MIKIFNSHARKDAIKSIVVTSSNIVFVNLDNGSYISKSFESKKVAEKRANQIAKQVNSP